LTNYGCREYIELRQRLPPFLCPMTPLHIALLKEDKRLFDILMDCGADVTATVQKTETTLLMSTMISNPHFTRAIVGQASHLGSRRGAPHAQISSAIRERNSEVATVLLEAGADIDSAMGNLGVRAGTPPGQITRKNNRESKNAIESPLTPPAPHKPA